MSDQLARGLRLIMAACADGFRELPAGSLHHKNLLFAQRLAAKQLADNTVLPLYRSGAAGRLREAFKDAGARTGTGIPDFSDDDVEYVLADLAGRLRVDSAPDAARLLGLCLEVESEIARQGEEFYRAEMAASTPPSGEVASEGNDYSLENLAAYLSSQADGAPVTIKSARRIPGGFSKLTFIIELGEAAHYPPVIVMRLDRSDSYLGTKVADEFSVIERLFENGVLVPQPLLSEPTGTVAGQPFIVVAAVAGATIGDMFNLPVANPAVNGAVAAELARLHQVPLDRMEGALGGTNAPSNARIVAWLDESQAAWTRLHAPSAIIDTAFEWLRSHLHLADGPSVIMHGDFGLNNILLDGEQVTALLDWEFVSAGLAGYDLGYFHCMATALGEWDDFLQAYREGGGTVPSEAAMDFFILFANVRLAIMVWQAVVGFDRGELTDLIWANPAANDVRVATLRIAERLTIALAREKS